MIDPITQLILENDMLDHMLEGYNMKCQECGKIIKIVKDGKGEYECCSNRMFVMKTDVIDPGLDESAPAAGDLTHTKVDSADFTPDNQADAQKQKEDEWEDEEEAAARKKTDNTRTEFQSRVIDPIFAKKESQEYTSELLGHIQHYFGDQADSKKK